MSDDTDTTCLLAQIEELNAVRLKAVDRANAEAEASATAATAARGLSMKDEADRLLAEHRNRTKELREAMQVCVGHTYAGIVLPVTLDLVGRYRLPVLLLARSGRYFAN